MPAYLVILSRFYTRRECVLRIAFFASSATLAGMIGKHSSFSQRQQVLNLDVGGLLAFGFLQVDIPFARGWRAIFFCEGIITLGSGLLAFFAIFNEPRTAKFLNAEEKILAETRIVRQNSNKVLIEATKSKLVLRAFKNVNTFACALGFGLSSLSLQGFALFQPTIIRALDPTFTTLEIQLKTVPVYACAFVGA
jgi:sugar phosphate permease